KDSLNPLLEAATGDKDARVRVSAIRALGSLKDKQSAAKLLDRADYLFSMLRTKPLKDSKIMVLENSVEKNELLEIATVLSRLLPNSDDKRAVEFLDNLRQSDKYV